MDERANRVANLRALIKEYPGGELAFSKDLGYASASFMSQMVGTKRKADTAENKKKGRGVTERTARLIEKKLTMPSKVLDLPPDEFKRTILAAQASVGQPAAATEQAPTDKLATVTPEGVGRAAQLIAGIAAEMRVLLPPEKWGQLAELVLADAAVSGGVRPAFVRALIGLIQ